MGLGLRKPLFRVKVVLCMRMARSRTTINDELRSKDTKQFRRQECTH